GAPTRPAARFCDQCGAPLAPTEGPDRAKRAREDVAGSGPRGRAACRVVPERDPEAVGRKVDAALRAMVNAIKTYDGTREKFIGDAVFAVFGWPHGHEDDAQRAAHCA